jgi:hypothetical protein
VLGASGFKTTIAEKAQTDANIASAGKGLTVTTAGKISGGSVTDAGVITILGNKATVGADITVILTPTMLSDGKLLWTCKTSSANYKYVPAECRH